CGDTKVVEKGKGDGIFITTAGVGVAVGGWKPRPANVRPGDRILLTGTMGDHQVAVLIARQRLSLEAPVLSDVAPLSGLLLPVVERFGGRVRFMRDPTRGGVGVTLNEMAASANARFVLDEGRLPVREAVRGVCEILGFDPLYLANEGKAVLIVDGGAAAEIVSALREHPLGREAAAVGEVREGARGVRMRTVSGGLRAVDYPVGDQLPRIC
ncbi:MAG: hydrogenase expression/formation protein HypE, partial [Deltaproteobacteria bacterium]|nr:hydrogenase expression/formation protein HypE [Deltaproteobacteria bacterium]